MRPWYLDGFVLADCNLWLCFVTLQRDMWIGIVVLTSCCVIAERLTGSLKEPYCVENDKGKGRGGKFSSGVKFF